VEKERKRIRRLSGGFVKVLRISVLLQRLESAVEGGSAEGKGRVEGGQAAVGGGTQEATTTPHSTATQHTHLETTGHHRLEGNEGHQHSLIFTNQIVKAGQQNTHR